MPTQPSEGMTQPNPSHPAPTGVGPGRRIGEWVLDRPLGAGAFGQVWQGHHHMWTDQLAAIKLPTDAQYVRSLQREGMTSHGLEHPSIVRPLGLDPYAEVPYLVMEYVPGRDLRALLREKGRLEAPVAVAILRQVLEALAYAHGRGVIHRDIKPENILLHDRGLAGGFAELGTVKVTDFGLGKMQPAAEPGAGASTTHSIVFSTDLQAGDPAAQRLAGTIDYMAPELRGVGGTTVDGRADLYACGVLLYEMLTGDRPAGAELPGELNPKVPAHLDEAFRRSYARLDKRFPTAGAFLEAIQPRAVTPPPLPVAVGGSSPCSACAGRIDAGDQFCMHCGHQQVAAVRRCGNCGAFPAADDSFCIFCGHDVRAHAPRTA